VLRQLRGGSPSGSAFAIRTERLTIRPLEERDVEALLRYRNIAGMEAFQDWSIPYRREDALALVEQSRRHAGPAPGEWVQFGVETDGEMVGDVAIWLDGSGLVAEIGATVAPEYHSRGFATEMVTGVIDWLFQERKVHRIRASHDPRNGASATTLDRLGFEYVGTIRSGHHVRGEWVDNVTWSLLEDDWRARRARAAQPVGVVELAELPRSRCVHCVRSHRRSPIETLR